jgi:hypothetical protein
VSDHNLHGYTIEQLDELARRAAAITSRFLMPFSERVGIARGAIAECLCRAEAYVEPLVLVTVGYGRSRTRTWPASTSPVPGRAN